MARLFDSESKKIIISSMREWKHLKDPYARISRLIPPFTAKQICHQWNNELDPRLNHDPLSNEEKDYVDIWVETNRKDDGTIHWKHCQQDMEIIFHRFHSTNKIKNVWNSKRKQKRNRLNENEARQTTFTFSMNGGSLTPFTRSLLNGIDNNGIVHLPTIEPVFQPVFPQLKLKPIF